MKLKKVRNNRIAIASMTGINYCDQAPMKLPKSTNSKKNAIDLWQLSMVLLNPLWSQALNLQWPFQSNSRKISSSVSFEKQPTILDILLPLLFLFFVEYHILSLLLGISNLQLMFEKLYDSIGASSSSSPEFEFMLDKLIVSGVEVLNQFSDVC